MPMRLPPSIVISSEWFDTAEMTVPTADVVEEAYQNILSGQPLLDEHIDCGREVTTTLATIASLYLVQKISNQT